MRVLILLALLAAGAAPGAVTLARDGRTDYRIVLPVEATPVERTAATELKQHLDQVTGATFELVAENALPAGAKAIFVGRCAATTKLLAGVDLDKLGHDGIVLRTAGDRLLLAGRPPRGTLYAVYTFLEDSVGCRWWTSTESTIPRRPTLEVPALDLSYAPKLRCREAFYKDAFNGVFAARSKLNGHFEQVAPEYGGHYKILGWCHTFYQLLPPGKYFAQHPEWYSERDGKRVADQGQLCLANAEMRAELVRNALAWIRKEPDAGMISIAQNDWDGHCQCAACRAAEAEEGSPSGPVIRFVNQVAQEIAKEYPDFLVETLAYQYTRKPPKLVRPRDNVVVRLCTIECSYAQPLAEGPQNETFRQDLEGWAAIAPKLYVWDYVTNFANFLLPHPNLDVLAPNLRTFVNSHAVGVFEQGDAYSTTGDFIRLRAWLLAHLMWDPDRDPGKLTDEFLAGYYGAAAHSLREYLDLRQQAVRQAGTYLRCYMTDTSGWLTLADATRAAALFARAEAAVADQPALAQRVRRERMPLDLAWLDRYAALKRQAKQAGQPFAGPVDPAAAAADYVKLNATWANGFYGEGRPVAAYLDALRDRFAPAGPPPEPCKGLPEDAWVDAQEGALTLHGLGNWVTIAADPTASNGKCARMPGSHTQWAVQWPLGGDLDDGATWRCYVVARCVAKAKTGKAFQVGLYDTAAKKGLATRTVTIEDAGDGYRTYDLGAFPLHPGCYLWVAPCGNAGEVEAVQVDRMFVVRQ